MTGADHAGLDLLASLGARTDRVIPGTVSATGLAVTWAETAEGGTFRQTDTATLETITAYTAAIGNGPTKKALTVKQPWAWAIIRGLKTVENRSRPTKHRGTLYIHAGKGWAEEGVKAIDALRTPMGFQEYPLQHIWEEPARATAGMIIGTVNVIDCHHADECWTGSVDKSGAVHEEHCSDWAMSGHYHWVLANARPLACPFPETGKLGIWNLGAKRAPKAA
jgi:hypothetical protein